MTPGGINIVRDAPPDHAHHHGLMFAFIVDGVNFWEEYNPKEYGRQETTTIAETRDNGKQKMESTLTWSDGVGQTLILEKRTITATQINGATVLDWTSTFTLPPGRDKAVLGGNDYHGLGMRFVESMDSGKYITPADAGKKEGRLIPCRWIAYASKAGDHPVSLVLYDTKDNPRPMLAFAMGGEVKEEFGYLSATTNLFREQITLTSEKPITFRYILVLWDGDKTAKEIEDFAVQNLGLGTGSLTR